MAGSMRTWETAVYSETLGSSSVIGQVIGGSHALLGSSLSCYRSHSGRSWLRRHSWCSRRHRPDFVLCLPPPTLDFVDYAFRQRHRALGGSGHQPGRRLSGAFSWQEDIRLAPLKT